MLNKKEGEDNMLTTKEKVELLENNGLEVMIINNSEEEAEILGLICGVQDEVYENFINLDAITVEGLQKALEEGKSLPYTEAMYERSGIVVFRCENNQYLDDAVKLEGEERRKVCEVFIKICKEQRKTIN
jgi:hypothetical protein